MSYMVALMTHVPTLTRTPTNIRVASETASRTAEGSRAHTGQIRSSSDNRSVTDGDSSPLFADTVSRNASQRARLSRQMGYNSPLIRFFFSAFGHPT